MGIFSKKKDDSDKRLELYSDGIIKILGYREVKDKNKFDHFLMKFVAQNLVKDEKGVSRNLGNREVDGEFVRVACAFSSKGGKMDKGGCFIMESKGDFHTVEDGKLVIYMAVRPGGL